LCAGLNTIATNNTLNGNAASDVTGPKIKVPHDGIYTNNSIRNTSCKTMCNGNNCTQTCTVCENGYCTESSKQVDRQNNNLQPTLTNITIATSGISQPNTNESESRDISEKDSGKANSSLIASNTPTNSYALAATSESPGNVSYSPMISSSLETSTTSLISNTVTASSTSDLLVTNYSKGSTIQAGFTTSASEVGISNNYQSETNRSASGTIPPNSATLEQKDSTNEKNDSEINSKQTGSTLYMSTSRTTEYSVTNITTSANYSTSSVITSSTTKNSASNTSPSSSDSGSTLLTVPTSESLTGLNNNSSNRILLPTTNHSASGQGNQYDSQSGTSQNSFTNKSCKTVCIGDNCTETCSVCENGNCTESAKKVDNISNSYTSTGNNSTIGSPSSDSTKNVSLGDSGRNSTNGSSATSLTPAGFQSGGDASGFRNKSCKTSCLGDNCTRTCTVCENGKCTQDTQQVGSKDNLPATAADIPSKGGSNRTCKKSCINNNCTTSCKVCDSESCRNEVKGDNLNGKGEALDENKTQGHSIPKKGEGSSKSCSTSCINGKCTKECTVCEDGECKKSKEDTKASRKMRRKRKRKH